MRTFAEYVRIKAGNMALEHRRMFTYTCHILVFVNVVILPILATCDCKMNKNCIKKIKSIKEKNENNDCFLLVRAAFACW